MGSLGGPLVFSGAQKRFIKAARDSGTVLIAQDVGSKGFFRTHDKASPHNLHGYLVEFQKQSKGAVAPAEQWAFAYPGEFASATVAGKDATTIDLKFSPYSHPHWNVEREELAVVALRGRHASQDRGRHAAQRNQRGDPLCDHKDDGRDVKGGISVPETLVAGKSGKGFAATGGKYIPVSWSKKGQFDPFVIVDAAGNAVALAAWADVV